MVIPKSRSCEERDGRGFKPLLEHLSFFLFTSFTSFLALQKKHKQAASEISMYRFSSSLACAHEQAWRFNFSSYRASTGWDCASYYAIPSKYFSEGLLKYLDLILPVVRKYLKHLPVMIRWPIKQSTSCQLSSRATLDESSPSKRRAACSLKTLFVLIYRDSVTICMAMKATSKSFSRWTANDVFRLKSVISCISAALQWHTLYLKLSQTVFSLVIQSEALVV